MDPTVVAQREVQRGFKVLPVKPDKESKFSAHGYLDASNDFDYITEWFERLRNQSRAAIAAIVPGSNRKLAPYGFIVIDVDVKEGKAGLQSLGQLEAEHGPLPQTYTVRTASGGLHYYFKKTSDRKIGNTNGYLAKDIDTRADAGYVVAWGALTEVGEYVEVAGSLEDAADLPEWIDELLNDVGPQHVDFDASKLDEEVLKSYNYMAEQGWRYPAMFKGTQWDKEAYSVRMKRPLVDGVDTKNKCGVSIGYVSPHSMVFYTASWEHKGQRYEDQKCYDLNDVMNPPTSSELQMSPEAFHGPLAEAVALFNHTEADPSAIMLALLTGYGNIVGDSPYVELVSGIKQYTRLNTVIVGASAKARKSAAWGLAEMVLQNVEPRWAKDLIQGGFGSGHILVDTLYKQAHPEIRGDIERGTAVLEVFSDKRMLVREDEFVRVLKTVNSENSVYSAVLRSAYDGSKLEVRSRQKTSVVPKGEHHVSVIGNITMEELQNTLTNTEVYNGFGNRLLFGWARKTKLVARSTTRIDSDELARLGGLLGERAKKAGGLQEVPLEVEAYDLWDQLYEELENDDPSGLLGTVIARGSVHTIRIALIFALADGCDEIRTEHLSAAKAVWDYCRNTAAHVFKKRAAVATTGDKRVDYLKSKVYQAIFQAGEQGIAYSALKGPPVCSNSNVKLLDEALAELEMDETVYHKTVPNGKPGRDPVMYFAAMEEQA